MYTYKAVLFRINKQSMIKLHMALLVSQLVTFYWGLAGDEPYRNLLKLANNWKICGQELVKNQSRQKHETQVKTN